MENIYLGSKVLIAFNNSNCKLPEIQKNNFRKKCLDFYIEVAHQIYKRFPFNSALVKSLKSLSFLEPKNIKLISSLSSAAAAFPKFVDDVNELDREWRMLRNSDINFNQDVLSFWKDVRDIKKKVIMTCCF